MENVCGQSAKAQILADHLPCRCSQNSHAGQSLSLLTRTKESTLLCLSAEIRLAFSAQEVALEILEELHVPTAEHTAQLNALGQPDQPLGTLGSSGLHQFIRFYSTLETSSACFEHVSDQTQISKPEQFASLCCNEVPWQSCCGTLGFTCPTSSKAAVRTSSIFHTQDKQMREYLTSAPPLPHNWMCQLLNCVHFPALQLLSERP